MFAKPAIGQERSAVSLRFIDDISIRPDHTLTGGTPSTADPTDCHFFPAAAPAIQPLETDIEQLSVLQFKYAIATEQEAERMTNLTLYQFIETWIHTPYRFGGSSLSGTDCSGFVGQLYRTVYQSELPRMAAEQYRICPRKLSLEELQEGDLVFFNTRGGVSHVGVYLGNGYFTHSGIKEGVTISRLDEGYYHKRFLGGGRPLRNAGSVTDATAAGESGSR